MILNYFGTTVAAFTDSDWGGFEGIVFFAVIILMYLFVLCKFFINKRQMKTFIHTEGEIISVERYFYHSGGRRRSYFDPPDIPTDNGYRVKRAFKIKYTYRDNDYREHTGEFQSERGFSGMLVGQKLGIYFNPKNPSQSFSEKDIKEREVQVAGIFVGFTILLLMFIPVVLLYLKVK